MNLILTGYRGAGKTSAGRATAEMLHLAFHDTDEWIQERTGKTIRQIVAEEGWDAFRAKERKIIEELSAADRCVIALGGGAVLNERNVQDLKKNGVFFWLLAEAATIVERLKADDLSHSRRPPFARQGIQKETLLALEQRNPVYRSSADYIVSTEGRTVHEIAQGICRHFLLAIEKKR